MLRREIARPSQLEFGIGDSHRGTLGIGFQPRHGRACLIHLGAKERGIQFCDHLPLAHARVEVSVQRLNRPRHLRADQHRGDRLDRARRVDRLNDAAARDPRRLWGQGVG